MTYTRSVKTNDVTGEQTYGDWTTDNADHAEVRSPEVADLTPNRTSVPSVTTTPDSPNSFEVVVYKPVPQPEPQSEPQPEPQPQPPTVCQVSYKGDQIQEIKLVELGY